MPPQSIVRFEVNEDGSIKLYLRHGTKKYVVLPKLCLPENVFYVYDDRADPAELTNKSHMANNQSIKLMKSGKFKKASEIAWESHCYRWAVCRYYETYTGIPMQYDHGHFYALQYAFVFAWLLTLRVKSNSGMVHYILQNVMHLPRPVKRIY